MKKIYLLVLTLIISSFVYSTPDTKPHKRIIFLGYNDSSIFYLEYTTKSGQYSSSNELNIIQKSTTNGELIEEILIRKRNYTADASTPQMTWNKEETINDKFSLNNYLNDNDINIISPNNLLFSHSIELEDDGIYITGKGEQFPISIKLDKIEQFVPWIQKTIDWKNKYHDKRDWNYGELRIIETYSNRDYVFLKVESGEDHPEYLFQQAIIPIRKK